MAARRDIRIDLAGLPRELAVLVENLRPGEAVTLVRDGSPVASITAVEQVADHREGVEVTVVATAMQLSAAARARLLAKLGGAYVVLDMHAAPATADVLIVPPVSPQLIGGPRSQFPRARIIVARSRIPSSASAFAGLCRDWPTPAQRHICRCRRSTSSQSVLIGQSRSGRSPVAHRRCRRSNCSR